MSFKEKLDIEFSKVERPQFTRFNVFTKLVPWFMDKVESVLDVEMTKSLTLEAYLQFIGEAFDKWIVPIDLPGPDQIIDPILKQVILMTAERLYQQLVKV